MMKRHFSATFVVKCVAFLGAMIQGVFVTRLLGPEGKGILSYLQANVAFLCLLLGFTLPLGVTYFLASEKLSSGKILSLSSVFTLFAFVILSLLVMLGSFVPSMNFLIPENYFSLFFILYLLFSFLFSFVGNLYYSIYSGLSRFYTLSAIELAVTLLRVTAFAFLYFSGSSLVSLKILFGADIFFSFLQVVFFYFYGRTRLNLFFDWRLSWAEHFKPVLGYILPLYWTHIVTFLYTRADLWIVERVRGLAALGVYSIALGTAQLLTFFPVAINTVLYTYLTKAQGLERNNIFANLSKINLYLVFSGAVFLFFAGEYLVPFLYGPDFVGAVPPLKILVWGYLISSVKFLFILYNQIALKLKENIISEIVVLIVSLGLNIIFVPYWGILGASISMFTANFLGLCFLLIKIHSHSELKIWECFVPSRIDLKKVLSLISSSSRFGKFD